MSELTEQARNLKSRRLECSKCGASAEASCNCGVAYVPAGIRAAQAVAANPDKSMRAIAAETGVSKSTIHRAKQSVPNGTSRSRGGTGSDQPTLAQMVDRLVRKMAMAPYGFKAAKFKIYPEQHSADLAAIERAVINLYREIAVICQEKIAGHKPDSPQQIADDEALRAVEDRKRTPAENAEVAAAAKAARARARAKKSPPELYLEICSATDPKYSDIRSRHYVVQKGTHGQQVHFLVWYKGKVVGIISGASAVFATGPRDQFFEIDKDNRTKCLNGIVDNVVFRLEHNEPNLASQVLALWEKSVAQVWEQLYEVKVFGFETFIVADDRARNGASYRAAGWIKTGETSGTPIKDTYCKWARGFSAPVESDYQPSWKAATKDGTPEEKAIAKRIRTTRRQLLGAKFFIDGGILTRENTEGVRQQIILGKRPAMRADAIANIQAFAYKDHIEGEELQRILRGVERVQ